MSIERVFFNDVVYERKNEDDINWKFKSHEDKIPIAQINMELYGETSPKAIVKTSDLTENQLYEYNWSVGMTGLCGFDWLKMLDSEDALLVQIIVNSGGTRFATNEVFASLEYMPPTKNLVNTPMILKRAFSASSEIAKYANQGILCIASSFVADIIPCNDNSKWYLNKFDYPLIRKKNPYEYTYGIEWHISRNLIEEVGARLVGRLGVIFIDAPYQNSNNQTCENSLTISCKVGLKLKTKAVKTWYDFSMIPSDGLEKTTLYIKPNCGGL
ncbi:hypothetical protein LNN31_08435 [Acetobacterium wieringae]|uniref:Uncharacterized protein n=1 Tax=Acetobacterium wieringae TaxID=52694 RepID=A0ABY6HLQ7_9FIRM|nr:hypothetical protein [Acetobacterium wieringae]UYO64436.1 hypothetical protein LNN31_08435 [Acetobacterium wieringae]VUZ27757.1 Uncharacterised protein [Acetobacterium wieringae]